MFEMGSPRTAHNNLDISLFGKLVLVLLHTPELLALGSAVYQQHHICKYQKINSLLHHFNLLLLV